MFKRFLALSFAVMFLLTGCDTGTKVNNAAKNDDITYMTIAIVGENNFKKYKNITYKDTKLQSLTQTPKAKQKFDALIINEDAFAEADKNEYVDFFRSVTYPVFFYGMDGFNSYAFYRHNVSMDSSKAENAAYVQGFINESDGSITSWEFHLPENPSKKDRKEEMLSRVLSQIEDSMKRER